MVVVARRALLLLGVAGCGRFAFDPQATDGGGVDGSVDGACDLLAPFGAPVLVPGVSSNIDVEATMRLSPDELRGYLWAARGVGIDLELATRADLMSPFVPAPITEINSANAEFEPTVSTDELVLVFHTDRVGTGGGDLWIADRASTALPFSNLRELTNLNSPQEEYQPFLTATHLYFTSSRGGMGIDVYRAPRQTATTFGTPSKVPAISVDGEDEVDAVLSTDQLTMYFASNRASGMGGTDVYVATRPTAADEFGAPTHLPQLSSAATDGPSWVSPDGCRLYLSNDSRGTPDVYMATRGL